MYCFALMPNASENGLTDTVCILTMLNSLQHHFQILPRDILAQLPCMLTLTHIDTLTHANTQTHTHTGLSPHHSVCTYQHAYQKHQNVDLLWPPVVWREQRTKNVMFLVQCVCMCVWLLWVCISVCVCVCVWLLWVCISVCVCVTTGKCEWDVLTGETGKLSPRVISNLIPVPNALGLFTGPLWTLHWTLVNSCCVGFLPLTALYIGKDRAEFLLESCTKQTNKQTTCERVWSFPTSYQATTSKEKKKKLKRGK